MKIIHTNLMNYFWKKGIEPIKTELGKKIGTSKIVNDLLTTKAGFVLDARQGKVLQDQVDEINSDLSEVGAHINAKKSEVSFSDAAGDSSENSPGHALDIIAKNINTYQAGISDFTVVSGNVYYVHLCKLDNNNYCGTIQTYNSNSYYKFVHNGIFGYYAVQS